MDSTAKVTFCGSNATSEKVLPEIHLLPCRIGYTGPAKVKSYFQRESLGENGEEKSTFRGRYLDGTVMHLPDGYKMFITKQRISNGAREVLDVEGSVDAFMLWEYDRRPSETNPIPRALNFLKIAEDLASDD